MTPDELAEDFADWAAQVFDARLAAGDPDITALVERAERDPDVLAS